MKPKVSIVGTIITSLGLLFGAWQYLERLVIERVELREKVRELESLTKDARARLVDLEERLAQKVDRPGNE